MAIKHAIQPDGTFSPLGQLAWEEEHVIEDATITPQKLDRVYLVVADLAPYQLTSQISTAAFRNEGYFSASSHASTHVTGGSDVIANFDATHSGLAPLAGTSTTLFLRGDGQWVAASGGVAWGAITGTLSDQTDLQAELDAKATSSVVIAHVALANPHTQYQMVSSLSSAAFRSSTYFAISSVVTTHIAQADPHTQYQLSSMLSSAAYRLATDFVASSTISTAAFRVSSFYVASSVISSAAYQLDTYFVASSTISTAAYRVSSFFVASSVISSAAYRLDTYFVASSLASSATYRDSSYFVASSQYQVFGTASTGTVPASGGGTANYLRADGQWQAPPGSGSDPWTYVRVSTTHFGTSNVPFFDIPGLRFTPGTNSSYEFESVLMLKTSTAAVTPVVRVRWPTACSSVFWANLAQTNSSGIIAYGNETSTFNTVSTGALATTTAAWPLILGGVIQTFGGTASSFGIMLGSESTTVFVSTMIGSYLKYRVY